MKEESKELLIKEFETSWQQLFNIDNRRGVFFNYFNLAFFAVLTFSIEMWVGVDSLNLSTALTVSGIYGFLIIMSNAVVKILESERAANVRYRKKINLIREIILSNDDDPQISMYLERKEIGIKTFSSEGDQIDKIGGTLLPIYFLLKLERIALGILIGLIWVVYVRLVSYCYLGKVTSWALKPNNKALLPDNFSAASPLQNYRKARR